MKQVKQIIDGEEMVHCISPVNNEFSLCGTQIVSNDLDMTMGEATSDEVTCEQCLEIERYVLEQ